MYHQRRYMARAAAKIQRWGNSLAVRLPKAVASEAGLVVGSSVELESIDGAVVVRAKHRYDLDELLREVKPSNVHGEVETGAPRGREGW